MTESRNNDSAADSGNTGLVDSFDATPKVDSQRSSWKDQWDHSPVRVVVVACVACIASTAAVVSYFDNLRIGALESAKSRLEQELVDARQESTNRQLEIDDLRQELEAARADISKSNRRAALEQELVQLKGEIEGLQVGSSELFAQYDRAASSCGDGSASAVIACSSARNLRSVVDNLKRRIHQKEEGRDAVIKELGDLGNKSATK